MKVKSILSGFTAPVSYKKLRPMDTAHIAHLLVHGFLHLTGHDHTGAAEAETMEVLERAILGRLEIADPFRESLIEETTGAND